MAINPAKMVGVLGLLGGSSHLVSRLYPQLFQWMNPTYPTEITGDITYLRFVGWSTKQWILHFSSPWGPGGSLDQAVVGKHAAGGWQGRRQVRQVPGCKKTRRCWDPNGCGKPKLDPTWTQGASDGLQMGFRWASLWRFNSWFWICHWFMDFWLLFFGWFSGTLDRTILSPILEEAYHTYLQAYPDRRRKEALDVLIHGITTANMCWSRCQMVLPDIPNLWSRDCPILSNRKDTKRRYSRHLFRSSYSNDDSTMWNVWIGYSVVSCFLHDNFRFLSRFKTSFIMLPCFLQKKLLKIIGKMIKTYLLWSLMVDL